MKKIILISLVGALISLNAYAAEKKKCSDLDGFKKIGKDSVEYIKCLAASQKFKLKTDSKVTEIITGKEKLKIPNPLTGLKKLGKAIKPDMDAFKKK
jgi:hypothetical protein